MNHQLIDLVQDVPIQIQLRSMTPFISSSKTPSTDINVSARDVPLIDAFSVDVFYILNLVCIIYIYIYIFEYVNLYFYKYMVYHGIHTLVEDDEDMMI